MGGGRRIDLCIYCEHPHKRVVGIEVKTVDASATAGQLEAYHKGLEENFRAYAIQVAYLTPFNKERAGETADRLRTIRGFEKFARKHSTSRHVSWLDVADISWNGSDLWCQHQEYVREHISSKKLLEKPEWNRDFAHFFGEEATVQFSTKLEELGIRLEEDGVRINLADFHNSLSTFATKFAKVFEVLFRGERVSRKAQKPDQFGQELRARFLRSDYSDVHDALLKIAERNSFVWVKGKSDYGIRIAHKDYTSGVSLVRSHGEALLSLGSPR